jgi:hypothetical protein
MITEKNNMHEFEPSALYKRIFKTFIAVYIESHTFDIVMECLSLLRAWSTAARGLFPAA